MERMETEELLSYTGGGILTTIANIVVSVIALTKAILSLRK